MLPRNTLIVVGLACLAWAQTLNNAGVPHTPPTSSGEIYAAYCASCHGQDGKGNGPASRALKVPPPDLTTLAKKNYGRFPSFRTFEVIKSGGSIAAHGSKEMPMWASAFRSLSQQDESEAEGRIRKLVGYLEAIQEK